MIDALDAIKYLNIKYFKATFGFPCRSAYEENELIVGVLSNPDLRDRDFSWQIQSVALDEDLASQVS